MRTVYRSPRVQQCQVPILPRKNRRSRDSSAGATSLLLAKTTLPNCGELATLCSTSSPRSSSASMLADRVGSIGSFGSKGLLCRCLFSSQCRADKSDCCILYSTNTHLTVAFHQRCSGLFSHVWGFTQRCFPRHSVCSLSLCSRPRSFAALAVPSADAALFSGIMLLQRRLASSPTCGGPPHSTHVDLHTVPMPLPCFGTWLTSVVDTCIGLRLSSAVFDVVFPLTERHHAVVPCCSCLCRSIAWLTSNGGHRTLMCLFVVLYSSSATLG